MCRWAETSPLACGRQRAYAAHVLRRIRGLAVLLWFAVAFWPATAGAQQSCGFTLGFKAIADQIPELVGRCLENERFNPGNGNAEQRTTAHHGQGGLLVWRKHDNWTAYTDGHWTWVNGPSGLQRRLNGDLLPGESPAPPIPSPPPQPAPAPAPPSEPEVVWPGGPRVCTNLGGGIYCSGGGLPPVVCIFGQGIVACR